MEDTLLLQMLNGQHDNLGGDDYDSDIEEMNLLDQINRLNINDKDGDVGLNPQEEPATLSEASRQVLNPNNPVFAKDRPSSKVCLLLPLVASTNVCLFR